MMRDEIREEKDFQHDKDYEQFDENHSPKRFSNRHVSEPVVVQVPNSMPKSSFFHRAKILIGNSVFFDLSRWQR